MDVSPRRSEEPEPAKARRPVNRIDGSPRRVGANPEGREPREKSDERRQKTERFIHQLDLLGQSRWDANRRDAEGRLESPEPREDRATAARRGGLILVETCRGIRGRYFPQTRLRGRCLELAIRFARDSVRLGPGVALGKAARRVGRKLGIHHPPPAESPSTLAARPLATEFSVSVIVPNFRHSRYLEERLRSVFAQTLPPSEIIFIDNDSPDDSVEVARRLQRESPVPMRVIVNERNNGSTFRQWIKGLGLARGDLIWIAESDDRAHPRFLERLTPEFRDPDVQLAYSQSALIGSEGRVLAENFLVHTQDISPTRWRSSYVATGDEEAEIALSRKNTVPNASAVVFRRFDDLDFVDELAGMRYAGDWLFHAMRIRGGKIAYAAEVLNDFRRHENSNSHEILKSDIHTWETLYVKARVLEVFPVSINAICLGIGQTFFEYVMLTERFELDRPPLTADPRAKTAELLDRLRGVVASRVGPRGGSRILMVLDSDCSDAERRSRLDLVNALARENHVFLCVASPSIQSEGLAGKLDDRVLLIEGTLGAAPWISHRDEVLKELVRFHEIDIVHSCCDRGDRLAAELSAGSGPPWVRSRGRRARAAAPERLFRGLTKRTRRSSVRDGC